MPLYIHRRSPLSKDEVPPAYLNLLLDQNQTSERQQEKVLQQARKMKSTDITKNDYLSSFISRTPGAVAASGTSASCPGVGHSVCDPIKYRNTVE